MQRARLVAVVFGVALGLGLSPVSSSAVESASIQSVLNKAGGGLMVANSQTNPEDETWSWKTCTTALTACRPFAQGRVVNTVGAPVPTVFSVTSSRGATTLSPQWNGRATAVSPPTVTGKVRANEVVLPLAGRWRGGWEGDTDWTQLAACKGPDDEDCTTLTDMHYVGGCRNGAAVIEPKFTGMYLRVADQRVTATTGILDYGHGTPYGPYIWAEGPTVSVAIVGQIKAASGAPATGCGPPLIEASISKLGVATLRCETECRASLAARQGKRKVRISRTVAPGPREGDAPELRLRARQLERFEPGPIRFRLEVDGWRVAKRTVQLG